MLPRSLRAGRDSLPALEDLLARDSSHSASGHDQILKEKARNIGPICYGPFTGAIWKERAGAARLRRYLMAWDAEEQEKARAILLDGKSPAEVQKDMAEAWKKFGVKLKFGAAVSRGGEGAGLPGPLRRSGKKIPAQNGRGAVPLKWFR